MTSSVAQITFVAIDLETTGLDPLHDHIVEIGLVKFSLQGGVIEELATLVTGHSSSREAREIHHIDDADLVGAPSIDQVLPESFAFMEGAVLVAHNLDFDLAFLTAAAGAQGLQLPDIPAVCTLQTCRRQLEGRTFSLTAMHKTATGQWRPAKHTALGDARAVHEILQWLTHNSPAPLHITGAPPPTVKSQVADAFAMYCRPAPLVTASLGSVLNSFPQSSTTRTGVPFEISRYQNLLNDAVEDARLTFEEADSLSRQAAKTRLTGTQLRALHDQAWLTTFGEDAHADWVTLTPTRRREMFLLADGLGLTKTAIQLKDVIDSLSEPPPSPESLYLKALRIGVAGDGPDVDALRDRAKTFGAKIAVNITKTVAWLATPTTEVTDRSMQKAHDLGIPVITILEGQQRLNECVKEAELKAFERQRQVDESEARNRKYAADNDTYWRPTWLDAELDKDPDLNWWQNADE